MNYKFPDELKYTPSHEWVKIDHNIATVGITDFAQHQLGDIVYIELPDKGTTIEREISAGEIESVKAVEDLIMPLSGEIIEINSNLADNPELVNSSPFNEGWILKIKLSNPNELNNLLSVDKYKELVKNEEK